VEGLGFGNTKFFVGVVCEFAIKNIVLAALPPIQTFNS